MRILLVSQVFWPDNFRINDLARALRECGCEVTVLSGQPERPVGAVVKVGPAGQYAKAGTGAIRPGKEHYAGIEVLRVPMVQRSRSGAVNLVANYLSFIASASVVGPWRLRGRTFDAIFVYGTSPIFQALPALLLGRLKHIPVATWVQDLWPESLQVTGYVTHPRALAAVRKAVTWLYRSCDLLLVQSRGFVPVVSAMAGATPVRYFPNPGELPLQGQAAAAPGPALEAGFNIVFAGNLGIAQSLDKVLDAAEQLLDLPSVRFVLFGSGQLSAWLAQELERRKLSNVQLRGRVDPSAIPAILAQASALLVSLNADPAMALTIPSKLQTYLAAGRPILASLDGEGAQLVTEAGAGLACPAGDAQALAQSVRRLHATPDTGRAAMGARGRAYFDANFAPLPLARKLMAELEAARQAHAARRAPG